MKRNIVFEHVKGGGRFYTSYDPEKTYEDDEYHLIVAKDVSDEMAHELCHERANHNATSFLDSIPPELRYPGMDAEIRDMIGADPVEPILDALEEISHIPPEGFADAKEFGIPTDEVFKASNAEYEARSDERKMEMPMQFNPEFFFDNPNPVFTISGDDDLEATNIAFFVDNGGTEILKLCGNGDIYVRGKLVENDKEVVQGLRDFLKEVPKS